jgi:hypothetical protein
VNIEGIFHNCRSLSFNPSIHNRPDTSCFVLVAHSSSILHTLTVVNKTRRIPSVRIKSDFKFSRVAFYSFNYHKHVDFHDSPCKIQFVREDVAISPNDRTPRLVLPVSREGQRTCRTTSQCDYVSILAS